MGNSLTKRDFRLQNGNLVYKMRFSFTKRDSWVTNGTLALHFTYNTPFLLIVYAIIKKISIRFLHFFFIINFYFQRNKCSL